MVNLMTNLNVLLLGAGVQSSALLEMSLLGVLPRYDLVLFADTGNEPKKVYQHVSYLQQKSLAAGVDFRIVSARSGDILSNARFGKFFAMPLYVLLDGQRSILRRQCTAHYKIEPTDLEMRSELLSLGLAKINARSQIRVAPRVTVNKHLGISEDEKMRVAPSRVGWQVHKYPLIQMGFNRLDCIRWFQDNLLPVPPKSSCIVCPYHDDAYWQQMADSEPLEWAEAVEFDAFIRTPEFARSQRFKGQLFLHPSCKPLSEVVLTSKVRSVQTSFMGELFFSPRCSGDAGFSCFS